MSYLVKVIFLFSILSFFACAPAPEPEQEIDLAAEEQAVGDLIDNIVAAVNNEDMESFAAMVSHDPEMVNFPVGPDLYYVGWDALREVMEAEWAVVTDAKLAVRDTKINVLPDGKHAWITTLWDWEATINGQSVQLSDGRWTGIFEKRDTGWVMIHYHDSVVMAEEEEAEPEQSEEG